MIIVIVLLIRLLLDKRVGIKSYALQIFLNHKNQQTEKVIHERKIIFFNACIPGLWDENYDKKAKIITEKSKL